MPFIKKVQLYSDHEEESINLEKARLVCQKLRLRRFEKGDIVFKFGDIGFEFYIILEG